MDLGAGATWIVIPIQILCVDLLLGADNAMAIALVCRTLHPADRRKGLLLGAGGAIVLRLAMTVAASVLLAAPYVKLIGGVVLAAIAIDLIRRERAGGSAAAVPPSPRRSLMAAASIIVIADAAMSVDNVIALAAIAHGNLWLLAAGVLLSIPLLACGSLIIDVLSRHFPPLIPVGAGLLGWIAGGMAISDPALVDWANAQAPALVLIAPALGALFVLSEAVRGDGGGENRLGAAAVAPAAPSLPPRRLLTNAAPRASSKPAPTRHAPISGAPRARVKREDRIMLVGLVILFLMAAAMIGFVMYMVQSYAVERFS